MRAEKIDEDLAEVIGVMIGDGCISQYKPKSTGKTRLDLLITGSSETDVENYREFIQSTMMRSFGKPGRLYERKDDNTIRYWMTNRKIVEWFVQFGLTVGPKIDRVEIPNQILQDEKLSIACLRGIFNTDGCVYRQFSKQYKGQSRHYSNYAVVEFKIRSEKLIGQIKEILNSLGIKTTVISKNKLKASVVRITSQPNVAKFMETVQPRKYHVERYKSIAIGKENLEETRGP
jgi:intein/homing endonuclease